MNAKWLKTSEGIGIRGEAGKTWKSHQIHCLGDLNSNMPNVAGSTIAYNALPLLTMLYHCLQCSTIAYNALPLLTMHYALQVKLLSFKSHKTNH